MSDAEKAKLFDVQQGILIGQGQFGSVYQVHLDDFDLDVAVKLVSKPDKNTQREIENQAKLQHRNLLGLICHFQTQQKRKVAQFIVMPLMVQNLEDVINSGEIDTISDTKKHQWMLQMLAGISFLHKQGMIHRDIKPGNMLLDQDENLYISDFGLSKNVEQSVAKTLVGTQLYMAPEIFENATYDRKADVYSLGCIWYEVLTNQFLLDVIQSSKEYNSDGFFLTGNVIHKLIPKMEFEVWDEFKQQCELMISASPVVRPGSQELYDLFKGQMNQQM